MGSDSSSFPLATGDLLAAWGGSGQPADRVQGRPMAAESQPGRCASQDKGLARLSWRAGGRSRQARDGWGRGAVRDAGADVQRYQTKQIRFGLPRGIRLSGRLGRQPVLDGWVEMARCARWDWQVPMLRWLSMRVRVGIRFDAESSGAVLCSWFHRA